MLAAAMGRRGGESFRLGWAAGVAYYLLLLHWLLFIPVTGFPILGWVALSAYLALFPAAWVWLASRISNFKFQISDSPAAENSWLAAAGEISAWSWSRRVSWTISCAAIWVAQEMIVGRLWGGFPWNLLGGSQYRIVPLIQMARVTGVYGLSFLVAWTSVSLLCAVAVILHRPKLRSVWMGEIILPFTAVAAAFGFGFHRLWQAPAAGRELRVALVQPSIPQTLIWDPEKSTERFQDLIRLSEQALTQPADLLVWPEAAIPKLLRYDEATFQAVTNLASQHHVWMIVGSDDAEPSKHSSDPKDDEYYNSSFLVSPEGRLVAGYRKRNLVIFGEYIPLVRWLPFIKWFTPIQGSFTPGDRAVPFELAGRDEPSRDSPRQTTKISVLICYEDTFAPLAREDVDADTDFLVNITNDGWFGEGAAQWQHATTALFRTVEEDVPLIRCTNTGLTGWYDACGRLREFFKDGKETIYGAGFMTVRIPLLAPGERRSPTFYHLHGDWFGWGCVGFTALTLIRRKLQR